MNAIVRFASACVAILIGGIAAAQPAAPAGRRATRHTR